MAEKSAKWSDSISLGMNRMVARCMPYIFPSRCADKYEQPEKQMSRKILNHKTAFTLVEMMIVVAIVGSLAALALPSFAKARRHSMENAFVEDLRILSGSIEIWAQNNGRLPADGPTGGLPVGMSADDFKGVPWSQPTPMGGQWDYDSQNAACNVLYCCDHRDYSHQPQRPDMAGNRRDD